MKYLPATLLLLSISVQFVTPDKILVLTFFSSKSHKITYMPLIEELALRGHQITVVTPVKADKPFPNITEVAMLDVEKIFTGKDFNMFEKKEKEESLSPFIMMPLIGNICRESYKLPQLQQILKESYDLVFIQPLFNECVVGIVHRLKAPLVIFFPTSVPNWIASHLGSYFPPSYVSNMILGYKDEMTFFQRFKNIGVNVLSAAMHKFYYNPYMESIYREYLGQDVPGIDEILGNASLILSNGHFSMSHPKPLLPDIVDVGGLHSREPNPLPKDLEDFVLKSKDGFIYFSMGSAIKGDMMSDAKRDMIVRVFSKLKQQVVWKWESETMPNLPPNVRLSKWLPQQDLLGHKNIRMFITHCGGGSTEEAVYHAVPLIGIPFYGDQLHNCNQAKNNGFLVDLEWNSLTEETLMERIQEILTNKKYKENVQKLSNVFKDQPTPPLERAVYFMEYVIRHKGAPQLRSAARKLNWFQYHSLDVISVYLLITSAILYVIFASLRWIMRKVCGVGRDSKSHIKKKVE